MPQLHPNVVFWNNIGYTVYGFERDARTALETIRSNDLAAIIPGVEKIASHLYLNKKICPIHPRDEAKRWCKFDEAKHPDFSKKLSQTMETTIALIHGDLHLRNILIRNETATLIDFARSNLGPIAIDMAKLTIDILIFCKSEEIKPGVFSWERLEQGPLKELLDVFNKYLTAKDDKSFFEFSLYSYASTYLTYPDVDSDVKKKLESLIEAEK